MGGCAAGRKQYPPMAELGSEAGMDGYGTGNRRNGMKHIYLNLKRFDIPKEEGGVNGIAPVAAWGAYIVEHTKEALAGYSGEDVEFVMYLPEAHLLTAAEALKGSGCIALGSQGIHREDVSKGGNFGAFTSNRTGKAVKALGCSSVLLGHCEERKDKAGILAEAGVVDTDAVNRILNKEIQAATAAGLTVLYCIGENDTEMERWQEVLGKQLEIGLKDVDTSKVAIAYEPIWSIGPGKTPAGREYIQKIAKFVKERTNGLPVAYGGGLKADNAAMLASIPEIDGGLIALTRFQGDIGFYPEEYLEIIRLYLGR